ncbi:TOMM precursor leader peptide-binding protein [Streptomyces sp. NBC_00344]|uniref:TOMM precursor leader peptide-binding protein n=1 Tax=Streptomyces sp. NBC_00344 TaxID=2975720 RepID=UPI002E23FC44
MTTAYEEVAHSHPRIRRDVLYTETPSGVVFHSAHGGFTLQGRSAYRFASLIVPHLNGASRVGEICAGLGDKQRAMVAELVGALYGRGFARDVQPGSDGLDELTDEVARRFAPQIDYIDHYAGEAGSRFRRFRETRVAVLGDGPVAQWCALSLVRNGSAAVAFPAQAGDDPFAAVLQEARLLGEAGCPVELVRLDPGDGDGWDGLAGYDVVLATGGHRTLLGLLEAGVPGGVRLLPAWEFASQAVIGPVMTSGAVGCWACAALRLGANGDPGAAADLWSGAILGEPGERSAGGAAGPVAAMVGNLLAYEVFRLLTGALSAETEGRIVIQDLDSLDVVTEPLMPHPRCPFCRDDEDMNAASVLTVSELMPRQFDAQEGALTPEADGGAALSVLDTRSVLIHPRAGVFTAFADDTWEQTPLKVGTVRLAVGHGGPRDISAFDVHHVAGARLRALHRAAEVYTERVVPQHAAVEGAALEAAREKWPLLAPDTFDIASGNGAAAGTVRSWVQATSLAGARIALVPAGAVRTFGAGNHDRSFVPTTAGSAAGSSPSRAAARALYSAVAFHSLNRALRAQCDILAMSQTADEADDREAVFLRRSAANLGLTVELLDLGGADGIAPVVLARAEDPHTGHTPWTITAAPTRRRAAVGALRDLLGRVQIARESAASAPVDTGDPVLGDLAPMSLAVTGAAGDPDRPPVGTAAMLARLRDRSLDALAVPTGSADLRTGGIHVVRVLLTYGAVDAL